MTGRALATVPRLPPARVHPRRRLPGAASLALLLAAPCLAPGCLRRAETPGRLLFAPDGARRLEWHRIFIGERPAGTLRLRELEGPEGGAASEQHMKLMLSREEVPVEVETSIRVEEDRDGRVLRFAMDQRLSRESTVFRGEVRGETLVVESRQQGGPPRRREVPYDPRAVGPCRAEALAREKLRREGDTLEVTLFFPEALRCGWQRATAGPEEEVQLPGGDRVLRRLRIESEILPGAAITQWVDEEHQVWKTAMPFLASEVVMYRSSQEEVAREKLASPPEILVSSAVSLLEPLPPRPREATYRIRRRRGSWGESSFRFPAGAGQAVLREEPSGAVLLRVRETTPSRPGRRPLTAADDLRPYLEPSSFLQCDDPRLRRLAEEVAGGIEGAWEAALALREWVWKNVREKNLRTAFATAAEVAESREGDCTEHAVLLAALARAAGIPSRVTAGLVYHGGAFVGHLWTEVHVGEWLPLDASRPGATMAADHIALARSSLSETSISELFLGLLPVLGNLEIELEDVRPRE